MTYTACRGTCDLIIPNNVTVFKSQAHKIENLPHPSLTLQIPQLHSLICDHLPHNLEFLELGHHQHQLEPVHLVTPCLHNQNHPIISYILS